MVVGSKMRALWARLTLLVVDDDGMSTVEYATERKEHTGDIARIARHAGRRPLPPWVTGGHNWTREHDRNAATQSRTTRERLLALSTDTPTPRPHSYADRSQQPSCGTVSAPKAKWGI